MIPIISRVYTSTAKGSVIKQVTCDKCATIYQYILTRKAIGRGNAPYMMGMNSAAKRAVNAARRSLAIKLEREAEMVPCPKCFWINQDLVGRYQKKKNLWVIITVILILAVGTMAVSGFIAANSGLPPWRQSKGPNWGAIVSGVISVAACAFLLIYKYVVLAAVDPNKDYPHRPTVPKETPPAILAFRDPRTGQAMLLPAGGAYVRHPGMPMIPDPVIVKIRSGLPRIVERLNKAEDPSTVAADMAPILDVTPAQIIQYLKSAVPANPPAPVPVEPQLRAFPVIPIAKQAPPGLPPQIPPPPASDSPPLLDV